MNYKLEINKKRERRENEHFFGDWVTCSPLAPHFFDCQLIEDFSQERKRERERQLTILALRTVDASHEVIAVLLAAVQTFYQTSVIQQWHFFALSIGRLVMWLWINTRKREKERQKEK